VLHLHIVFFNLKDALHRIGFFVLSLVQSWPVAAGTSCSALLHVEAQLSSRSACPIQLLRLFSALRPWILAILQVPHATCSCELLQGCIVGLAVPPLEIELAIGVPVETGPLTGLCHHLLDMSWPSVFLG
jgi:hypothetical protein